MAEKVVGLPFRLRMGSQQCSIIHQHHTQRHFSLDISLLDSLLTLMCIYHLPDVNSLTDFPRSLLVKSHFSSSQRFVLIWDLNAKDIDWDTFACNALPSSCVAKLIEYCKALSCSSMGKPLLTIFLTLPFPP